MAAERPLKPRLTSVVINLWFKNQKRVFKVRVCLGRVGLGTQHTHYEVSPKGTSYATHIAPSPCKYPQICLRAGTVVKLDVCPHPPDGEKQEGI